MVLNLLAFMPRFGGKVVSAAAPIIQEIISIIMPVKLYEIDVRSFTKIVISVSYSFPSISDTARVQYRFLPDHFGDNCEKYNACCFRSGDDMARFRLYHD